MGGKKRRRAKDKELRKDNKQQPVSLASAATSTDPTNAHCEKKRRDSVAQAARYPATTAVLAIVAVCFVSYANGLDGDFVFDDTVAIVTNADVQSNGSTDFSAIWNHDFWGKDIKSEQSHKSFRPLTTLSFRASFLMSGSTLEGGTFAFHAPNVFVHACVSGLLFSVLFTDLEWGFERSLAAALHFAAHPCHVEAVTGIVGRAELLAGAFMLSSFSLYVRATSRQSGNFSAPVVAVLVVASACLAALGFLCKETAIVVYACNALFTEYLLRAQTHEIEMKEKEMHFLSTAHTIPRAVNFLALTLTLVFRAVHTKSKGKAISTAFSIAVGYRKTDNQIPFVEGRIDRLLTTLHSYVTYVRVLVFPLWLSCDYSYNAVPSIEGITDARNLKTLGVALCFLLCAWLWLRFPGSAQPRIQQKVAIFALLWSACSFLPVSNLLFHPGLYIAERVLYMPSVLMAIFVSYCTWRACFFAFQSAPNGQKRWTGPFWIATSVVVALYVARTRSRNLDWQDQSSLFRSALTVTPGSAKVQLNVGIEAWKVGNFSQALRHLQIASEIDNEGCQHAYWMGRVYLDKQDYDNAIPQFQRALNCQELSHDTYAAEALEAIFRMFTKKRPRSGVAHSNLANVLVLQKRFGEAHNFYTKAIALNPEHADFLANFAYLKVTMGDRAGARDMATRALRSKPGHATAVQVLSQLANLEAER